MKLINKIALGLFGMAVGGDVSRIVIPISNPIADIMTSIPSKDGFMSLQTRMLLLENFRYNQRSAIMKLFGVLHQME